MLSSGSWHQETKIKPDISGTVFYRVFLPCEFYPCWQQLWWRSIKMKDNFLFSLIDICLKSDGWCRRIIWTKTACCQTSRIIIFFSKLNLQYMCFKNSQMSHNEDLFGIRSVSSIYVSKFPYKPHFSVFFFNFKFRQWPL